VSNIELPKIDPTGYIRTYVPLAIGAILGWLIATYTLMLVEIYLAQHSINPP